MFKWKSADRPSTPKLGSVALPAALSPVIRTPMPIKSSISEKPAKSSFFSRFRSTPPSPEKTRKISLSDRPFDKAQVASFLRNDEDEILYKPPKPVNRTNSTLARTRVTLVQSKASKEEEMERREEMERMEEEKRLARAQMQQSASRAGPRKSCLKGGSSPDSALPTPSPQSQHAFPSSYPEKPTKTRDSSPNYYSDTEQYRPSHRSSRRSQTYLAPHQHLPSYPPDPRSHPQYNAGHRSRNQSLSDPRHQVTPGYTPKYMKAYIKEVPLKDAAIALSWQLVDFDTRRHARYPALFFDAAFDPRLRGYEVKVMRYGEAKLSPISRDEETQLVSPHAFMSEMVVVNERLSQWPVVVRNPRGVRCIDVFRAIYDTYSIVLTKAEIMHWGKEYIDGCQRAFGQRCNDGPQLPPVTKAKGICRIDLLKGERIFKGLTPLSGPGYPPNCWKLQFEQITRPRN